MEGFLETALGGGSVLAVYKLVQLIIGFIEKSRKSENSEPNKGRSLDDRIAVIESRVESLWACHDVKTNDGTYVWYVAPVEREMKSQNEKIEQLAQAVERVAAASQTSSEAVIALVGAVVKTQKR